MQVTYNEWRWQNPYYNSGAGKYWAVDTSLTLRKLTYLTTPSACSIACLGATSRGLLPTLAQYAANFGYTLNSLGSQITRGPEGFTPDYLGIAGEATVMGVGALSKGLGEHGKSEYGYGNFFLAAPEAAKAVGAVTISSP